MVTARLTQETHASCSIPTAKGTFRSLGAELWEHFQRKPTNREDLWFTQHLCSCDEDRVLGSAPLEDGLLKIVIELLI